MIRTGLNVFILIFDLSEALFIISPYLTIDTHKLVEGILKGKLFWQGLTDILIFLLPTIYFLYFGKSLILFINRSSLKTINKYNDQDSNKDSKEFSGIE